MIETWTTVNTNPDHKARFIRSYVALFETKRKQLKELVYGITAANIQEVIDEINYWTELYKFSDQLKTDQYRERFKQEIKSHLKTYRDQLNEYLQAVTVPVQIDPDGALIQWPLKDFDRTSSVSSVSQGGKTGSLQR